MKQHKGLLNQHPKTMLECDQDNDLQCAHNTLGMGGGLYIVLCHTLSNIFCDLTAHRPIFTSFFHQLIVCFPFSLLCYHGIVLARLNTNTFLNETVAAQLQPLGQLLG